MKKNIENKYKKTEVAEQPTRKQLAVNVDKAVEALDGTVHRCETAVYFQTSEEDELVETSG